MRDHSLYIIILLSIATGAASMGWLLSFIDAMEEAKARRGVEDERDRLKERLSEYEKHFERVDIQPFLRSVGVPPSMTVVRGGQ